MASLVRFALQIIKANFFYQFLLFFLSAFPIDYLVRDGLVLPKNSNQFLLNFHHLAEEKIFCTVKNLFGLM